MVLDDNPRLRKVEGDVSDLKIRMAVAESNIKEIKEDVSSIKGNTTWILRLVIGAIVGAIVSFTISGGLTP